MKNDEGFYNRIDNRFTEFLSGQSTAFPPGEILSIDLHCHDRNSDVPDELLARILGIPETWLPTEDLMDTLLRNGCDTYTVTNHNNARSCYELRDRGIDVVTGAEFSCTVPDFGVGIHVLTYGFTPSQEEKLNALRSDLYRFLDYTRDNDIPTIWAHPLYHYKGKNELPMAFFDTMALVFERFEAVNGQRDTRQNLLVKQWVDTLTPERIDALGRARRIKPDMYTRSPYRKVLSGGSDCHTGLFAGLTGTRLHIPDLPEKLKIMSRSKLALEAIKEGRMVPYGTPAGTDRITISLLDYFCQIGLKMDDPGLLRMMLHKGAGREKLLALVLANGFSELRRHKLTMTFLDTFHGCFTGRVPGMARRVMVSKPYRGVFSHAVSMARTRRYDPAGTQDTFVSSIRAIYDDLSGLLMQRITEKVAGGEIDLPRDLSPGEILERLEVPSSLRNLFAGERSVSGRAMSRLDLSGFMDGLSFPFLASSVILGANFTGARVMYRNRELLDRFAETVGGDPHPKRMLWMTDTFEDDNGVSTVLRSMLDEIRRRNLPIDLLVSDSKMESGDHLVVVPPLAEFTLPFYPEQPVRIPDLLKIHDIFREGAYDRIMASTEGPMGMAALYLKEAYTVPAFFYVHTDWMMFARETLKLEGDTLTRFRRILRAFYRSFDLLFVLNREQKNRFCGEDMAIPPSRVRMTAHWAEDIFKPSARGSRNKSGRRSAPVLLYAGRLSEEKGVKDLPEIYRRIREAVPGARMVIAGKGPMEDSLRRSMPDAEFLGWVEHSSLPDVYLSADVLLMPSRFDTFGCVVLEALSTGLPVAAYRSKGPAEIIGNSGCGFLARGPADMAAAISKYLAEPGSRARYRLAALERASMYSPDRILEKLLNDTGLPETMIRRSSGKIEAA